MLRIIKDRKPKYISIGFSCPKEHWDPAENRPSRKHPNRAELNILINEKINKVNKVLLNYETNEEAFTLEEVEKHLRKSTSKMTVAQFSRDLIKRLEDLGKLGTATTYKDALRAVMRFTDQKDITFTQLDQTFLIKLEEDLLKRGIKENSISVYMRTLRALYNKAIMEGYAKEADYPFKTYKVSKLNNKTRKRAITKADIKKIQALTFAPNSKKRHAQNYFLLSYLWRGINFIDLAYLKWDNIKNDRLNYTRAKTGQNFTIAINPMTLNILNEYQIHKEEGGFIFPILSSFHNTEVRKRNRLKKVIKEVNKELKEIGQLAGIEVHLTTYVARHTFATVLKREGVSIATISEGLGHSTERITQVYLDEFESSVLDEADKFLL
jgi:site-specific recombinase XerD